MTPEPTINNTSSGAVATHGSVAAGEKGIAVGGNVEGGIHYHEAPSSTSLLRATPPPPPPHFTGREDDLKKFTQLLTSGENVAITALQGMGGIGKTALAQKLAEELQCLGDCVPPDTCGISEGRPYFPGGVLWWTLGPNPDVITALDVWARHADPRADLSALPDAESRANIVRAMLAQLDKLCVIIADVWTESSARTLMSAVPPHCPILITTRDGDLAGALRCNVQRIDALSVDEAVAMLTKLLGSLSKYEAAAREIAQLTEGLPLALELIYGLADSPADLPALAKKLRERPMLNILKLPGDEVREKSIEACLAMSYTALDADTQRRFRALGVFAPAPFDRDAIAAVWAEQDEDVIDAAIKQLVRRSLLSKVEGAEEYRQHALLHAYALALLNAGTPTPNPPPSSKSDDRGRECSLACSRRSFPCWRIDHE
ncbi:MAG TPA: NB-ARC domain-containing protein [Anaerolineae bacterium]